MNVAPSATMRKPARILIIYSDSGSERTLRRNLERAGYVVVSVALASATMGVIRTTKPGVVVLAVGRSETRAQDLCRQIRGESRSIVIFVVSAKADVNDVVHMLELGADDYMTEPLVATEFVARVRARLIEQRLR